MSCRAHSRRHERTVALSRVRSPSLRRTTVQSYTGPPPCAGLCFTPPPWRRTVAKSDHRARGRRRAGHEGSVSPLRAEPTPRAVHGTFFAWSHRCLGGRRYEGCVRGCCLATARGTAVARTAANSVVRGAADALRAVAVVVHRATLAATLAHRRLSYWPVRSCRAIEPARTSLASLGRTFSRRNADAIKMTHPRPPSCRNVWDRCSRRNTVLLHVRVRMLSSRHAVARVAAATTSSSYRHVRDHYQSSAVAPSRTGLLRIVV